MPGFAAPRSPVRWSGHFLLEGGGEQVARTHRDANGQGALARAAVACCSTAKLEAWMPRARGGLTRAFRAEPWARP